MAAEDPKAKKIICLACSHCEFPIAPVSKVLVDKFPCWDAEVYSYPLEILELDDVWCYSATNPSKRRFDVVRVLGDSPGVCSFSPNSLTLHHTWFPGYAWNMASCVSCSTHLGWGFVNAESHPSLLGAGVELESDELEQPQLLEEPFEIAFFGVISTSCKEVQLAPAEFEELTSAQSLAQVRADNLDYQLKVSQCYSVLRVMADRRKANELGMLLYAMEHDFEARSMITQLRQHIFNDNHILNLVNESSSEEVDEEEEEVFDTQLVDDDDQPSN